MKENNDQESMKTDHKVIPLSLIMARGLTLGILTGITEILVYILFYYEGDQLLFSLAISSISITALAAAVFYFFLWFIVRLLSRRLSKNHTDDLSIGLAVGIWTEMMGIFITDTFRFSTLTRHHQVSIILISLASILIGWIVYILLVKNIFKKYQNRPVLKRAIQLVFGGLVLFGFFWFARFYLSNSLLKTILAGIVALGLYFFIFRLTQKVQSIKIKIMMIAIVFLALVIAAVFDFCYYQIDDLRTAEADSKPHRIKRVFLLTVDTLRPDFLSCYNPDASQTPHIDQIRKDGILFQTAISTSPWTLPSFVSVMTGLPAKYHQVLGKYNIVPDTLVTLAETVKKDGYVTAGITNNPYLTDYYQMDQGFDTFRYYPKNLISQTLGFKILNKLTPDRFLHRPTTEDLSSLTIKWLNRNSRKDFFFWLHILDPHMPYTPPEKYIKGLDIVPSIGKGFWSFKELRSNKLTLNEKEKDWVRTLYNAEIKYVDDQIGIIIDHMKALDIYDETLIVFLSDHGEEFWEHGGFEHGHTLYNEQLHVPLIIKLPFSQNDDIKNNVVRDIVGINHVMATILDLCGSQSYEEKTESVSLKRYWETVPKKPDHQTVFSEGLLYGDARESVIFDQKKFIRSMETDAVELFDLYHDPGETKSLARTDSRMTTKGETLIEDHAQKAVEYQIQLGIENTKKIELSEEAEKQLKSLGYIF